MVLFSGVNTEDWHPFCFCPPSDCGNWIMDTPVVVPVFEDIGSGNSVNVSSDYN